jgi:hypothetical protein
MASAAGRSKSVTEGKNNIVPGGFHRVRSQDTLGKSASSESMQSLQSMDLDSARDDALPGRRSRRGSLTDDGGITQRRASIGTKSRRSSGTIESEPDSAAPMSQEVQRSHSEPTAQRKLPSERLKALRLKSNSESEMDSFNETEEGTTLPKRSASASNLQKGFLHLFLDRSPSPPCTPGAHGVPSGNLRGAQEKTHCDSPGTDIGLSRRQILTVLASSAVCTVASKDMLGSPRHSGLSWMSSAQTPSLKECAGMVESPAQLEGQSQSPSAQTSSQKTACESAAAAAEEVSENSAMNLGILAMSTSQAVYRIASSTSNAAAELIEEFVEQCDINGNCQIMKCTEEGCVPCAEEEGCIIPDDFYGEDKEDLIVPRAPSNLSIMKDLERHELDSTVAQVQDVVHTYATKLQQVQDRMQSFSAKLTASRGALTSEELLQEIDNMKQTMIAHWDEISLETVRGLRALNGAIEDSAFVAQNTTADVVVEKETMQSLVSDNLLAKRSLKELKKQVEGHDVHHPHVEPVVDRVLASKKTVPKLTVPRAVEGSTHPGPLEVTNIMLQRFEASLKDQDQASPDGPREAPKFTLLESVQQKAEMFMTTFANMSRQDLTCLMTEPLIACGLRFLFQKSAVDQIGDLVGHGVHPLMIGLVVGLGCSVTAKAIADPLVKGLAGSSRNMPEGSTWSKYFHDVSFTRSFVTCFTQLSLCGGLHTVLGDLPPHVELSIQALLVGIAGGIVSPSIKNAQLNLSKEVHRKLRNKRSTLLIGVLADVVLFTSLEALRISVLGLDPINIYEL